MSKALKSLRLLAQEGRASKNSRTSNDQTGPHGSTCWRTDDEAEACGNTNSLCVSACSVLRCFCRAGKFGTLRIRNRIARELFELEEETPLLGSRLRCFVFMSPVSLCVYCFTWL